MKDKALATLIRAQKDEITEYHIYTRLAAKVKDKKNAEILKSIGNDELRHYEVWKRHTGKEVKPNMFKVRWYIFISRFLGITFGIKMMERGEEQAQVNYNTLHPEIPDATKIQHDEENHENELIEMIDEDRLQYIGSIVRGLNDALVELTGALAGFTLALKETRLIAMAGLITGIAASMSMAASEYLAIRSEKTKRLSPVKSAFYTGSAYILTVFFLIFPYLIFSNIYLSLGIMALNAVIVIFLFNFYNSVAMDRSFKKQFTEMVAISLGVAVISFLIGFVIRSALGVDV